MPHKPIPSQANSLILSCRLVQGSTCPFECVNVFSSAKLLDSKMCMARIQKIKPLPTFCDQMSGSHITYIYSQICLMPFILFSVLTHIHQCTTTAPPSSLLVKSNLLWLGLYMPQWHCFISTGKVDFSVVNLQTKSDGTKADFFPLNNNDYCYLKYRLCLSKARHTVGRQMSVSLL